LPHSAISEQTIKQPETLAKHGISQQKGANQNYDKSVIHLPRHSSFTINHTFVNGGIVRHNVVESLVNTTV
jgi:hypothetical protein